MTSSHPPPPLTVQSIEHAIDKCLLQHDPYSNKPKQGQERGDDNGSDGDFKPSLSLRCRRGLDEDMKSINSYFAQFHPSKNTVFGDTVNVANAAMTTAPQTRYPCHFYIILEEQQIISKGSNDNNGDNSNDNNDSDVSDGCHTKGIKGAALFYFGYSTWKGKVMNLDTLFTVGLEEEKAIVDALVKIAQCLDLGRIIYQVQGTTEAQAFRDRYDIELLGEWLTLQMSRDAMISFLGTQSAFDPALSPTSSIDVTDETQQGDICPQRINGTIDSVLSNINPAVGRRRSSQGSKLRIRRAETNDAKSMSNLVHGLALYEKELDEVDVDEKTYQLDGYGENPFFHCILLELDGDEGEGRDGDGTRTVVGMGFFYLGYSMADGGRFLYLEDLFIEEKYRGNGFGKAIMYSLAEISKRLECERFVWQALDWNSPALNFYDAIGAKVCQGLITLRFDREKISGHVFR